MLFACVCSVSRAAGRYSWNKYSCPSTFKHFPGIASPSPSNLRALSFKARSALSPQHQRQSQLQPTQLSDLSALSVKKLPAAALALAKSGIHDQKIFAFIAARSLPEIPSLTPRLLTALMKSFAMARVVDRQLFHVCAAVVIQRTKDFSAQEIASLAYSFACQSHHDATLFDTIAEFGAANQYKFSSLTLSNLLWAFATMNHAHPLLFAASARHVVETKTSFSAQSLATVLWAFARIGFPNTQLFSDVSDVTTEGISRMSPRAMVQTVWAFSTVGLSCNPLFAAVAQRIPESLPRLECGSLSMLAWSFAKQNHHYPELMTSVCRAIYPSVHKLTAQAEANLAYAVTRSQHRDDLLLQRIADDLCERSPQHSAHSLSMILFSLSGAPRPVTHHLPILAPKILARIQEFDNMSLSSTAWAYAKVGVCPMNLFEAIATSFVEMHQQATPNCFAVSLWSIASAGVRNERILGLMNTLNCAKLAKDSVRNLSMIAFAFAKMEVQSPAVFGTIESAIVQKADELTPQIVRNLLWAFSSMGVGTPQLYTCLSSNAFRMFDEFKNHDLPMIAWSLVVSGRTNDQVVLRVLRSDWSNVRLSTEQLMQLYQTFTAARLHFPPTPQPFVLDSQTLKKCQQIHRGQIMTSSSHRCASASLEFLKVSHINEHEIFPGIIVDIAIPDRKVALEVDGPSHFIPGTTNINALTRFRNQMIQKVGWKVLSLPYHEWSDFSLIQWAEYLRDKLKVEEVNIS
jgi:very-short-patch-repair endonuclease